MKTHLVVIRCGMDDLPSRLFKSKPAAIGWAKRMEAKEVNRIKRILNLDTSVFIGIDVFTFDAEGRFESVEHVRDFDKEGENAPEWGT